MTANDLMFILGLLIVCFLSFVYLIVKISKLTNFSSSVDGLDQKQDILSVASVEVDKVFNDEFREELKNRARLRFEEIIKDNAMFLQQDLRLTTANLNDYLKSELIAILKEEFAKYQESISDAKQLAIDSIEKTNQTIDEQRQALSDQLKSEFEAQKAHQIAIFSEHLTEIANHYIVGAIGQQIDLNDQLDYIIAEIEANKDSIIEDLKNGA